MSGDLLADLNPQQRQAVTAPPGPVLVLAGPGSGKTRVLAYRIAYLVQQQGVPQDAIVAVTFTNKAAREMGQRVSALLGYAPGMPSGLSLSTFHSLCARMLRREAERLPLQRSFVIFDEADQHALMRQTYKDLNLDPKQNKEIHPARVHAAISNAKNELVEVQDYPRSTYFDEVTRRVYERYQELLLLNNALDFDDLLFWVVRMLNDQLEVREQYRRRFAHLLVDEFQDTNTAQYRLLRLLAGEQPDLFVVGDADQSIYRWRGADYRNVQRFEQDYPQAQILLLEQNYRSTQRILDAAMAVIDRLPGRHKKRLFTERGVGPRIAVHEAYDEEDEALFVVDMISELVTREGAAPGECAVMYRTNAQSRALEEAFFKQGMPYRLVGAQRFYGRREVRDLIAYLRLVHNPADQVSLLRILNTPPRGIGAKTVERLLAKAERARVSPSDVLLDLASPDPAFLSSFAGRSATALTDFGQHLREWLEARSQLSLIDLIDRILADVRYHDHINDGTEEGQERWANVLELRGAATELPELDLTLFLEHVALVSDQDTLTDAQDAPVLLTLHAAKGLEFKVVFIIGLDEGILPHQRSFGDTEEMAEERRLFYVGITRCKDNLFLLRTFRRRVGAASGACEPSRFLSDIPPDLLEGDLSSLADAAQAVYRRQTTWERPVSRTIEARYRTGMRVQHPVFGEGLVLETQLDGDDEEVTVAFAQAGIKRLAASLAELEILSQGE
jgi:DNA helicase-2/ATP-dependent DNA helicase PcrA